MRIQIATEVDGHYQSVMDRFDRDLFEALTPPSGLMEIVEFTGSKAGDRVHIRFLQPVRMDWVSEITEDGSNEEEAYFVDEGVQLPFPLAYWQHKHLVRKLSEDTSLIIDDISFRGRNRIWTNLLYPAIYAGFYPRKKIYRKYFND